MTLLFSWPGDFILIAIMIVSALVLRAISVFLVNRVVKRLMDNSKRLEQEESASSRLVEHLSGVPAERRTERIATVGSVLRSIVSIIVYTVMLLTILTIVGIPTAPLLASAGIGGVALGFGAQALVKDFLSGLFLIIEDQYGVGDVIRVGDISGTVESVTLRVTKLRDMGGQVWYIRNGEITTLGNVSQGWSMGLIDIPVAIDESPEQVMGILNDVAATFSAADENKDILVEPVKVAGLESMAGGTSVFRLFAKCGPNQHWAIQRRLREQAKAALAKHGIRGPLLGLNQPS